MKKNTSWEYREKILFAGSAGEFFSAAKKALDEINDASAAASVGLDLVSFLKEWKLRAFVKAGTLTEEQIDETADAFFDLTKKLGGEEAYQEAMKGVYTTSVNLNTIDESPMAYKSLEDIIGVIGDTVDIIDVMRPIYNFKAAEEQPYRKRQ